MSPQQHGSQHKTARIQLGDTLVERGVISMAQLKEALEEQKRRGHHKLLGEVLIELNFASQEQVMESLAECYGVPFARLNARMADPRITEVLPRDFIESHCVLPLFKIDNSLTVAVSEPANLFLVEEIERLSGCTVQVVAAIPGDIRTTLQAYLPSANVFVIDEIYEDVEVSDFSIVEQEMTDLGNLEQMAGQSPVVKLVNFLIYQAVQDRASDIHIEPEDHSCRARYRVDGRLVQKLNPPHQMHPAIVSRIKIMAHMDISERRLPQDGDIHVMIDGRPIDLRISTLPGKFGEKVVIRIIDNRSAIVPMEKIGFGPDILEEWKRVVTSSNGVVLVTGPTGSGKSTTLYSVLSQLATDELNISTVENPVEVNIPGINQFQVNDKTGFTFSSALRSLLRQDPDILMVGEIRDAETATIATQAALTGHVVFSTLHTNDSVSAVTRLVNMGIEPYLVAAVLRGILAQRLVRKICPHCKEFYQPDDRTVETIEAAAGECKELFRGAGCSRCLGKGYAGRLGIFELLLPNDQMLEGVGRGLNLHELREIAAKTGYRTLRDDGFIKAKMGLTTVEEVMRVCTM
ncbi:MAG: type II/IV secretion system protein [Phycisphaeraceae bacterium]|nr:MAG: type II/IV secretion system protein [Phycisphaeraceae bacterium]